MNYTFKYFNNDELIDFLKVYPYGNLCKFISDNSNHFRSEIKGFRPNRLPPSILYKIYCDEIFNSHDSLLEKYVINMAKLNFKDTKIEELIDTMDDNILITLIKIEEEIREKGLTVSSKHILKLAGFEVDDDISNLIDFINQLIYKEKEKSTLEATNRCKSLYENELQNVNKKYNSCLEERKIQKTKNKELIKSLDLCTNKLNKQISKNSKLVDMSSELEQKIKEMNDDLKDFTTIKGKFNDLKIENENYARKIQRLSNDIDRLKNQIIDHAVDKERFDILKKETELYMNTINELRNENEILERSQLHIDVVKQLSLELLDDLQTENISEKDFIKEAKRYFSNEENIKESWERLNNLEINELISIEEKMKTNKVTNEDIHILDDIENCIQYKYIIIKGLKIVFYKFLEQESMQKTLAYMYK
ncbi:hypothetical protein [Tissierella sp. Yu-01]|uniref:hypothetical protein n=1 Tax=Tissierella sp. Yu-01 TaxID=3035694 RepID=UPI00240CEEAD|nr:hypothetical protein [Tissierella sp. Yu-01]WFA10072.1 hypothetical protein P3962_05830 [Tissierella sp. Yu-01]